MSKWGIFLFLLIGLSAGVSPAIAQQTVGDGTVFVFTPGKDENYGINSSAGSSAIGAPLYRQSFGDSTGIGSSTLQTTAPTGAGSGISRSASTSFTPAVTSSTAVQNLPWTSQSMTTNPALSGITTSPTRGLSSPALAPFSSFGSLYSSQVEQPTGLFQDMQAIPSFNRHIGGRGLLPLSGASNDELFKKVNPHF